MKFEKIYRESILFWPNTIDISDGKFIEETNGFYLKNLSSAWNKAEELASNEWQDLMVWTLFKMIHTKAEENFKKGVLYVDIQSLDLEELKSKYLEDLQEEYYEDMLAEYEG